jgi:hypothetical protein
MTLTTLDRSLAVECHGPWMRIAHGARALRFLFAAVLLVTGIAKLLDIQGFAAVVATYRVLPSVLLVPAALALALTEIGVGIWLTTRRLPRLAASATVTLHLIYLAWLTLAYARGLELPNCGCYGVYFPHALSLATIGEDVLMLVAAGVLLWGSSCGAEPSAGPSRR